MRHQSRLVGFRRQVAKSQQKRSLCNPCYFLQFSFPVVFGCSSTHLTAVNFVPVGRVPLVALYMHHNCTVHITFWLPCRRSMRTTCATHQLTPRNWPEQGGKICPFLVTHLVFTLVVHLQRCKSTFPGLSYVFGFCRSHGCCSDITMRILYTWFLNKKSLWKPRLTFINFAPGGQHGLAIYTMRVIPM